MKKTNFTSGMQLLLLTLFLLAFTQCEPNIIDEPKAETIDSCEQYAGIKNVFKVTFEGNELIADSIRLSVVNRYPSEKANIKLDAYNFTETTNIRIAINISLDDSVISFVLRSLDSSIVDFESQKVEFSFLCIDTLNTTFCGKFHFEYDTPDLGVGQIECEFINMEKIIATYPFNYELDVLREYSYDRIWYYVGSSDGDLSNFTKAIPYTLDTPRLFLYSDTLGEEYSTVYKYNRFASTYNGAGALYGSWKLQEDELLVELFDPGWGVNYVWEYEWATFHNSLYSNVNNYYFEKEHNILKVYYNEGKQALIYYAKPEEYNDTLYLYHDLKNNNNENKIYTNTSSEHNLWHK